MGGAAQEDLADRMACPKKGARGVVAVYKPSGSEPTHRIHVCHIIYMVTFTINIPQMLAYIPYMDPMGYANIGGLAENGFWLAIGSNQLAMMAMVSCDSWNSMIFNDLPIKTEVFSKAFSEMREQHLFELGWIL